MLLNLVRSAFNFPDCALLTYVKHVTFNLLIWLNVPSKRFRFRTVDLSDANIVNQGAISYLAISCHDN